MQVYRLTVLDVPFRCFILYYTLCLVNNLLDSLQLFAAGAYFFTSSSIFFVAAVVVIVVLRWLGVSLCDSKSVLH